MRFNPKARLDISRMRDDAGGGGGGGMAAAAWAVAGRASRSPAAPRPAADRARARSSL